MVGLISEMKLVGPRIQKVKQMITYGSLFTGVGGFELGLNRLNWENKWMCEKDTYAADVLQYHWPKIPLYEDITKLHGYHLYPVDVIVGGFPCQDISKAGNSQLGLNGTKSILFYEYVRIVKEMREKTNGQYPKAVIWENVPGLIHKNKNWISDIYTTWAETGALEQEHRLIDAQYFGVPQRRKRIIGTVIFHPRTNSGTEILSDTQNMPNNVGKSRTQRQNTTTTTTTSTPTNNQPIPYDPTTITNPDNRQNPKKGAPCHTLTAYSKPPIIIHSPQISATLIAHDSKGITEPEGKLITTTHGPRKLTPKECERLMGWPDNWTAQGANKPISDKQRYKMCGNGIVSQVAEWAGRRIEKILE